MDEFEALGARVWAVAQDDPQRLAEMAEGSGLEFPVLHDPEGEVILRYGLGNEAFTRGVIPHPAALVIDRDGTVAWKRIDVQYQERPSPDELLDAVRALGPAAED